MNDTAPSLLAVRNLSVEFRGPTGWVRVIDDVAFDVKPGEVVGVVGESGSGKTVTSLSVLGLIEHVGGRVASGASILFEGEELTTLSGRDLNRVRGRRIGMIFQQPTRNLDPAFRVGDQIAETIRQHAHVPRREARDRAVALLEQVRIPDPARRARQYAHELSGGMCQRVMIAMALACSPSLLIADEPTTALDVTVQARVLDLLREIQQETNIAIMFVSHDLGVIADICDSVVVMYAGQVVETAPVEQLFLRPQHPYTAGLLSAIPRRGYGRILAAIPGSVPDPSQMPPGCRFHPRCAHAVPGRCDADLPKLMSRQPDGVGSRCLRADELTLVTDVMSP